MDRHALIRSIFASWFDPTSPEPPLTDRCRFHAFDRFVDLTDGWRESLMGPFTVGFPDIRWQIHRIVADDDWGAAHLDVVGTHLGPWRELDPTGRRIAWEHMFFLRFEGDLVAEMWEVFDPDQLERQLTDDAAPEP
jgi:predicted ester cyclase